MSEEFSEALKDAKKGTAEEKIDALASIIEDMMHIILEMPEIFDEIVDELNEKIIGLDTKLKSLSNLQTSNDIQQVKPLPPPPPPPPIEQKEKTIHKSPSTKRLIMDELKELFAKKKGIEKKQAQCKDCKNYQPIDDVRGTCFGLEVPATQASEDCPKKQFQPRN